ncbi:hypothetical protein Pla52o_21100 [Novipirellula galeiformis]|uniref:DUF2203 domain-containing protein n=1 Tax=Novipirellula galeiformis TaxID=2528004 RepID=A0A5C6CM01_9BACT|nr:DUF2203 family protein [Novipirellula galeiformis]TWU24186.1 hypothetical protein Pla52o_21100 [Novipirellula galeiformis]
MVRALPSNDGSLPPQAVLFTPARATEMLPLLKTIMRDAMHLNQSIQRQRNQIEGIDRLAETIDHPSYRDEVNDIRGTLVADEARLDQCIMELTRLGVEPHLPLNGSIDFPAILHRQAVRLCWTLGEESVEYWHDIGQDASVRRPLPTQSIHA